MKKLSFRKLFFTMEKKKLYFFSGEELIAKQSKYIVCPYTHVPSSYQKQGWKLDRRKINKTSMTK